MQKQSMQAAMLKDIHNQRLGSLSSSSAASEKSKSHSDLSSIELGKLLEPAIQIKLPVADHIQLLYDRTHPNSCLILHLG